MHRTVVNPGVDEELDLMKRNYNGMENLLNDISREIAAMIPERYAVEMNVIFFPQVSTLWSFARTMKRSIFT